MCVVVVVTDIIRRWNEAEYNSLIIVQGFFLPVRTYSITMFFMRRPPNRNPLGSLVDSFESQRKGERASCVAGSVGMSQ